MGIFGNLFGPSWEERVAVFMQERRLPVQERIRLCVKNLTPQADHGDLLRGLPVPEIQKYLTVLDNCDEMTHLAVAMHRRKVLRMPVVLVMLKTKQQWEFSIISDKNFLPKDDGLRYRRFENDKAIIWNPVDDFGEDLVACPKMTYPETGNAQGQKPESDRTSPKSLSKDLEWVSFSTSSVISRVAYQEPWGSLHVQFRSGEFYVYFNVPRLVYAALLKAPSKGEFFNEQIKGCFDSA